MIKLIRFFRLLMLPAILALAASACNDDNNFPDSSGNDLPEEKDSYIGQFRDFVIDQFQSDIQPEELVCKIMTPDGSIISRKCDPENMKAGKFRFFNGLKEGNTGCYILNIPHSQMRRLPNLSKNSLRQRLGWDVKLRCRERTASASARTTTGNWVCSERARRMPPTKSQATSISSC